MKDRIFIDSNILLYTVDDAELPKQNAANSVVQNLAEAGGVISTQVLQEFYNVAVNKLKLPKDYVKELIERLADCFTVHKNSVADILRAIDISIRTKFSFWDSLIISASISENCNKLYSEDLNDGQIVENVLIQNPL
ncbi:MAG: PIN domain-containing protein [Spirochaetaceae bacterium]|nr:PIN domain-containing protein [Spirochaetaceae bacterium]